MKEQSRILIFGFLVVALVLSGSHAVFSAEAGLKTKLIINISSNRTDYSYQGDKAIPRPNMSYYPHDDIKSSLKKAGFRLLPEDAKDYDLSLEVNYKERYSSMALGPGQTREFIDRNVAFVLRDKAGAVIFEDELPGDPTQKAVKAYFVEDLPKLVKERPSNADRALALVQKLQKEGFNRDILKRLSQLNDPSVAEWIVPILRTCYASHRWYVKFTLWDLGYEPKSASEKAAFDMVELVKPFTWYNKYGSRPKARLPGEIIQAYGIPAIDLFLQDLECEPKRGYYEGDATARNARKALMSLHINTVSKKSPPEWKKHAVRHLLDDLAKEDAESSFRAGYVGDVIQILGAIGENSEIEPLKRFSDHPRFEKAATAAIKSIQKRQEAALHPTEKKGTVDAKTRHGRTEQKKTVYVKRRKTTSAQQETLPSLILKLNNQRWQERDRAALILGRLKDPQAVDPLIGLLKRENERQVLLTTILALGKLRDIRAVEPLINAMKNNSDRSIKGLASASLRSITGENHGKDPAKWQKWWNQNKK